MTNFLFKTKKRKLIFSLALVLLVIAPLSFYLWNKQAGASWWNSDWNYRRSITINSAQIPGDLNNFPMLVSFTDSNLINKTQSNGNDIIFIQENGTRLNHEIETYNNTTGELVAWVKIPQLEGDNDSIIYMYYGNQTVDNQQRPEDVWDEGFKTVQHLEEGGTGARYDSTRNNVDGTPMSYDGDESALAKINGGDIFDGSDDYIRVPDNDKLDNFNALTLSAWVKTTDVEGGVIDKQDGANSGYRIILESGGLAEFGIYGDTVCGYTELNSLSVVNDNAWKNIVGTWDGSSMKIYINGVMVNQIAETCMLTNDIPLIIGRQDSSSNLSGIIDEVRISNSARSANWITTEYNNQNSPSTFISLGSEERGPSPALYLPFDEGFGTTAHDETSNRNDGTIVGATWKDESMCKSGKCLEFDGTGDYVEIADNQSLDLSEEVTLEAWVKPTSTTPQNQTILSKVETPNDPTKIYRSVGPSATTAIAVGTSNAMNITGDRATFATALPDNVGVGDVIQYDANDDGTVDALAFITGRISNTQYTISNASGGVPNPINSDNNWSLFRAYTSLANAEKGVENTGIDSDLRNFDDWTAGGDATTDDVGKDLVAANQQWNIACYANGTTADATVVTVNDWTTAVNNFINIYTPVNSNEVGISQRHRGVWDENKYFRRLAIFASNTIGLQATTGMVVRFVGLQIEVNGTDLNQVGLRISDGTNRVISDNIIRDSAHGSESYGILFSGASIYKSSVFNNIVYGFSGSNSKGIRTATADVSEASFIYNNTVFNSNIGIETANYIGLKNNIVQNCTTPYAGTSFYSSSFNNLSSNIPSINNAFGATHTTGTTDGTTANKLINSAETFITKGVQVGSIIKNTTDNTYTYVTALDSETQLSIANDIFILGEGYEIYKNKYGTASFISTTAGSEDFHLSPTDTVAKNSGADLSGDSVFPFNTDIDGQSRLNLKSPQGSTLNTDDTKFDIGADEARATQIYRSVAPNKTDALEDGEDNSMTIVGSIATFQRALADNIGVGDVIQYDDDNDGDIDSSDSLAFVTGRISNTQYTISNASGGTPVPVNSDNDWSLFRAYTSLANAENGDENTGIDSDLRNFDTWSGGKDLVTNKEQWNIACYTNGVVVDDLQVAVTGWTTGAQNIIKIYTPVREDEVGVSQRHIGIMNTGYKQSTVSGHSFIVYEDFVFVDGLEIEATDVSSPFSISSLITDNSKIILSNSLVRGGSISPGATTGVNNKFYIINSIIGGVDHDPNSKVLLYVLNSTINGRAVLRENTVSYFKNVISNTDDAFLIYSGAQLDCTYCALKENKGTDWTSGANNKINQTFNFVNEAGGDYHLAPTDTAARNAGINLANDPNLPITTDIDGQSRIGDSATAYSLQATSYSYDIGADEAVATKIYRSVGPGNTSALATDESHENVLNVLNGLVSFSSSLPDRVGVGDAVLIDTNNDNAITSADTLLFISGRNSSTSYNLQTHTGAVPTNISSNDTYQIYRAHTSLANAEAGTKNTSIPMTFNGGNRDLVANNEEWNIACYGDAVDVTATQIDGWMTGAENFIKIYTPTNSNEVGVSQRHNGKWDDEKYRLEISAVADYARNINIREDFVIVEGIQVKTKNNDYGYSQSICVDNTINPGSKIQIINNIVWGVLNTSNDDSGQGIYAGDNDGTYYIYNNIVYGFNLLSSSKAVGFMLYGTVFLNNNTAYNNAQGIRTVNGTFTLKNNISSNNLSKDFEYVSFTIDSTNNLSLDATAPASGTYYRNATVTFRDAANDDYRLAMTDTSAKGAGLNLSYDANLPISSDIEGEKRLNLKSPQGSTSGEMAAFDIGADQISSTTHNNYSLNLKTNYPQTNFSTADNDQENFSSGDINLAPNEWSHLVYKRSNDREEMYINGSKKDSGTISNFLKTNNGKLYLGAKDTNSTNSFKGFLDEVRIYPYARTEAEVKKDTTQGSSGRAASRAAEGVSVSIGETGNSLSDGLVGYWKMDETSWNGTTNEVIDASGNNNHGTRYGNATTGGGKFGNGGVFDGTNNYVSISSSAPASLDLKTFTLAFWAKRNSLASTGTLISTGLINNNKGFQVQCLVSNLSVQRNIVGNNEQISRVGGASDPCSNTNWHYYTIVIDGASVSAYSDGNSITLNSSWTAPINSYAGTPFNIGTRQDFFQKWDGQIDETRIYNRALSPDEIKQLYNYAPGPVLHLKLDEKSGTTAYDSSGNDNHGTLVNGPIWENGKINGGMKFNGTDNHVDAGTSDTLYSNIFTIAAWVNGESSQASYGAILGKGDSYSENGFNYGCYYPNSTSVDCFIGNGSTRQITSHVTVPANTWYHLSFSSDGNNLYVYIDGKNVITTAVTISGNLAGSGSKFLIGALEDGTSSYRFKGQVDDVKVYNYARTQEQILEDMGASAGASSSRGAGALGHPILDLNFDEGQGATAFDASGNNNHGTLVSGTTGGNTTTTAMWDKGGKKNGAMEFDGTDDYILISDNADINPNNQWTVVAWVKLDNISGGRKIVSRGSSGESIDTNANTGLSVDDGNVKVDYEYGTGGTNVTRYSASTLDTGVWYFISGVYTGGDIEVYVNGALDNGLITGTPSNLPNTTSSVLTVGAFGGGVLDKFDGKIDEVKIYNYALSEDEIKTLYNGSSAMAMGSDESRDNNGTEVTGANKDYCVPGDTAKCDKPVLELKMNEKSGTSASDSSGNGNNGGLYGNTSWERGKINGGLRLDGTDDYIRTASSPLATSQADGFTGSIWANLDRNNPGYIWELGGSDSFDLNWAESGAGDVFCRIRDSVPNYFVTPPINVSGEGWHYFSCVLDQDRDELILYVDGVRRSSASTATFNNNLLSIGPLNIGARGDYGGIGATGGVVDELKFYEYARTPAQIAWDYNRGKPISHWTFDEGNGTTAHDLGEGENHGTITGATWKNESECKTGKCLYFNGLDLTRVDADTQDNMNNFTACAWVNAKAWTNPGNDAEMFIFSKGWSFGLMNNGKLRLFVPTSGGYPDYQTASTMGINEWHRVCTTFAGVGQDSKIFIDGIDQELSTSWWGTGTLLDNSAGIFRIGAANNEYYANFYGYIDDPKIYNYALTDEQIKMDYNEGAVNFK